MKTKPNELKRWVINSVSSPEQPAHTVECVREGDRAHINTSDETDGYHHLHGEH
jgi:hypothetical protein